MRSAMCSGSVEQTAYAGPRMAQDVEPLVFAGPLARLDLCNPSSCGAILARGGVAARKRLDEFYQLKLRPGVALAGTHPRQRSQASWPVDG
jgi:hypothetical protein